MNMYESIMEAIEHIIHVLIPRALREGGDVDALAELLKALETARDDLGDHIP